MNNLLISCYFTSRRDPQRGELWKPDDFSVMREWYWTARQYLDSDMVLLHDGLSPAFLDSLLCTTYFCNAKNMDKSLNDARFYYWRNHIANSDCDRALITDISDVEFYKNPFKLMEQGDESTLYIGSNDVWSEKPKFHNKLLQVMSQEQADAIMNRPLINPGIIGGSKTVVMRFLLEMCRELTYCNASENMNMPIANKIIYYGDYKISTGHPLHTRFKKYEGRNSGAYVRHK